MRVNETIVRAGYFWTPEDPENKLPGTLTISDGGEIGLEVLGNFDASPDRPSLTDKMDVKKIIGEIEKSGYLYQQI